MKHEILYQPSYSLLKLKLDQGEQITAESGAMVSMSDGMQIETSMKGGLMSTLKRSVLGGESFFMNTFTANSDSEITFAPALPGDLTIVEVSPDRTLIAQSGAFLVSEKNVNIDTKWGGAKTFFSKEGLFLLKLSGEGKVFLSSYGAIHETNLSDGQKYTVDTGHMVAFEESVSYNVKKVGNWKSTILSGEGLVVELTGPGKIYLQTRSQGAFLSWLLPKIPKRTN